MSGDINIKNCYVGGRVDVTLIIGLTLPFIKQIKHERNSISWW